MHTRSRFVLDWGLVALLVASCSAGADSSGSPLALEHVTPLFGDFRQEVHVTLAGSGFTSSTHVFFGESEATVVSRSRTSLEVSLAPRGTPGRVAVIVRDGKEESRAGDVFGFRAMAPEALLFVDAGQVADGAASAVFAGDFDGDGKQELVLAADGAGRVVHHDADGFSVAGTIDAQPLAVARLRGRRDELLVGSSAGLELARFDQGAFVRTPVEGISQVEAIAVRHALPQDEVAVVGKTIAGDRALFTIVASADSATSVEALVLGDFAQVSVALEDLDGDGAADVLLGGKDAGPRLLLGDGHGAFADAPPGTFPSSQAGAARVADLDADGHPDVVVATAAGEVAFLRQGARFVDRTAATFAGARGSTVAFVDLDVDGAVDRIASNPGLIVHRNDGSGRFFDYTPRAAATVGQLHPLAAADLDADGDPDLLAADDAHRVHWLENWAPHVWKDTDKDGIPDELDPCPDAAGSCSP